MNGSVDVDVARWAQRYAAADLSLGDLLCDAHVASDALALVYEGPAGVTRLTYAELRDRSVRLAGALREEGVGEGDRVAVLLPKSPELLVSLLAIWRLGAVHVPLFTAFGPDAVEYRIEHSGAVLVITDVANRDKLSDDAPRVVCVGASDAGAGRADIDFADAIERGLAVTGVVRGGDDLFVLLYTSGTTGHPKGVEVPVRALASIQCYMRYGLDVTPDDVLWNFADPGWAYGLYYAVIGPLLIGTTTLMRGVPFDAQDFYAALLSWDVTNLAGAPTVYRALRAAGAPPGFREASRLRAVSSAGEPLNAELRDWAARDLGVDVHDHYGQTELGMAVYFPHHPALRRPPVTGAMGVSGPGYRAVVVDDDGAEAGPGTVGDLAIDVAASPHFWFRGYFGAPELTAERFAHGPGYYLTGDAASVDDDGLLHFASRADDVITSSGYRIGPFEVESALMKHPSVVDVAVIGTPDELRVEAVTAFVVPAPSVVGTAELAEELKQFVKSRLAKHLYPRHVVFVDELPRTPSGKVRRAALREQWAAGEVSTS